MLLAGFLFCLGLAKGASEPVQSQQLKSSLSSDADEMLNELLNSGQYKPNIRAFGNGNVSFISIRIQLAVQSIDHIDESDMKFGCQILLRQKWQDLRLQFNHTH